MSKHKNVELLALAAWAYLLSGCVPAAVSYRANPRFQQQSQQIQTVSLLPPKVKVYQIDVGGVREEITEWSTQARTNVVSALDNELRTNMKTEVKIVSEESLIEEKERAEDSRALYAAVSAMILLHTYPNPNSPSQLFEEKLKNFDYSLGTEVGSLAKGADALLFLDAQDHVWTAGRQALQTLGVILGIGASIAAGVATQGWLPVFIGPLIVVMSGGSSLRAALVDSGTGDILWINAAGSGAGTDLRDPAGARAMVSELFKDFPVSYDRQPKEQ
jgi:hypothetical protein